ncbi:uncharacterized protein METZ01_LOCUS470970, partial [marine metagenome]
SLKKRINIPKKQKVTTPSIEEYDEVRVLVYTLTNKLSTGKKVPDLMEIAIGGTKEEQINFIKENSGKDIPIEDVFEDNAMVDIRAITKGKGFQGPVKRFGISLKAKKSEKGRRNPGSLGPWKGQTHIMWKVAHAGQTGFHQRTEYNKQIIKVEGELDNLNPKGGINNYGLIKNKSIILKGSIPGPKKRLIVMTKPIRQNKSQDKEKITIEKIVI